jgi:hypothetical protein
MGPLLVPLFILTVSLLKPKSITYQLALHTPCLITQWLWRNQIDVICVFRPIIMIISHEDVTVTPLFTEKELKIKHTSLIH